MRGQIVWIEPVFFLLFGLFHLHRIWGLLDRTGYASLWTGLLRERGLAYYVLPLALALLCVAGISVLLRRGARGCPWRWLYLLGGGYVLFDLAAILSGWTPWLELLEWMFDVSNPAWDLLWGGFSLMGLLSLLFGIKLWIKKSK